MTDIYDTNAQFPFDKVSLTTPTTVSGGIHFSKIFVNKNPLYIQSPKCKTKMGIVKTGKKMHADLVFTNDDEEFIQWIETLEQTVRKHIFTNKDKWFDMDLDEDDIESYFSPTVKLFKSGKQYIMRVNISQRIGSTPLKIYDENEEDVESESIDEKTSMISILEIQGVRCSTKSFQIDTELKQIMVVKPLNLFEKCIIKKSKASGKDLDNFEPLNEDLKEDDVVRVELDELKKEEVKEEEVKDDKEVNEVKEVKDEEVVKEVVKEEVKEVNEVKEEVKEVKEQKDEQKEEEQKEEEQKEEQKEEDKEEEVKEIIDDIEEDIELDDDDNTDDILEINLDIDEINDEEPVHLKEKTEVYYQLYKEARQKAKLAKSLALSSYLEARRIKNLYMLDNIDDSDESDFDLDEK
jgi:hypothetical protein